MGSAAIKSDRFGPRVLAASAVMTVLVLALTYVRLFQAPSGGYINPSDIAIYFAAFAFGPWVGLVAGGLGGAAANLLAGHADLVPLALVVHGLQGFIAGWIVRRQAGPIRLVVAVTAGGAVLVGGYFLGEFLLFDLESAISEVPWNTLQALVGTLGSVLYVFVANLAPGLIEAGPSVMTPAREQRGLMRTLLAALHVIGLLPMLVVWFMASGVSRQTTHGQVFDQLTSVATVKSEQLSAWANSLTDDLALLLADPVDARNLVGMLALPPAGTLYGPSLTALEAQAEASRVFEDVWVADERGVIIYATAPEYAGVYAGTSVADQPYFRSGRSVPYVQVPSQSEQSGLSPDTIVAAIPIRDELGESYGVLGSRVDVAELATIMRARAGLGETGETYLVDVRGRPLTPLRFGQPEQITTLAVERALAGQSGQDTYQGYYGETVVGVYQWVPRLGAVLVAERAESEAFAPIQSGVISTLIAAALAALFGTGAAVALAQGISAPVIQMADTAQSLAEGNLDVQIEVQARHEIGVLADSFRTMIANLRAAFERIASRERVLVATTQLSREAGRIQNVDRLLQEAVNLIQDTFGYYHVHVYMLNEAADQLVVRAGSGEVGRQLKARGHGLDASGRSVVAFVTQSGSGFLARDVSEIDFWQPNPLLPETHSELAVPIRGAEYVIGVLDMQSVQVGGFDEEDLALMQSLADQIAVALENIQLVQHTEALAQRERLINLIGQKLEQAVDVDEVLRVAVREAAVALKASRMAIQLGADNSRREADDGGQFDST
jgi:uncharacterized membrane protein/putative methionine-R-sulfoxide reductase with GAF domain/HAMP domain-containing protein